MEKSSDQPSWVTRVPLPLWVLVCAVLWGSAFPMIKLAFAHWAERGVEIDFGLRSLFAGARFFLAGGALLLLANRPGAEWRATPKRWIAAMAATQTVGQYVCFYLGLALAGGALASLLVSSGSFWWMLLAPWILKTARPTTRHWAVLAVGAVGLTLAVYSPGDAGSHPRIGAGLILAANAFGALGLISFQFVGKTMGSRAGTGWSLFLGGVVLVFLGMQAWPQALHLFDGTILAITVWLAFVSASAFALWNWLSTLFPVHLLATYRFMVPLCGMVESLLLIEGERITPLMGVGAILVVGAMIVAQREKARGRFRAG
ncbi:DMT family transporter [Puniceicoccus vermicola]|uniref:DMT family transporter n=1 Tax=Puniceicoccus vermicola TaxID=388746 RepID=A0A7X1AUM2_9BACT|nr:DMT family transporter [Puniceicoccus vermicola]MBC2600164.1 DMT family transporter [Puniceicoccus vermicola]